MEARRNSSGDGGLPGVVVRFLGLDCVLLALDDRNHCTSLSFSWVDVLEKRPHSFALFSKLVEYAFGFLLGPTWGLDDAEDFTPVDFALVDFTPDDFTPVDFTPVDFAPDDFALLGFGRDALFFEADFAGCFIGRGGAEDFAPIDEDLAKIILLTKKGDE